MLAMKPKRSPMNDEQRAFAAKLGNRVRERRESLGLSRDDLAKACGLSFGFVRDVEQGLRRPILDAASELARALGWTLDELVSFAAGPTPTRAVRGRPKKSDGDEAT